MTLVTKACAVAGLAGPVFLSQAACVDWLARIANDVRHGRVCS